MYIHLGNIECSRQLILCFPDCGQPLPGDGGGHGGAQLQAPGQKHLPVQVQELRGRDRALGCAAHGSAPEAREARQVKRLTRFDAGSASSETVD